MKRRFAARGLTDRVRFVDAIDGSAASTVGDDQIRAVRGCFASHLEVLRQVVADPVASELGAVVAEDDVLLHRDFAARERAALANQGPGSPLLIFGFMLSPPDPDLRWTGRDPARHNLVGATPGAMWGSHCYWISPEYAASVLDDYGDLSFDELPTDGTENFTVPASAQVAWPPLALQEASDSAIRPLEEMEACHRRGQRRWNVADYLVEGDDSASIPLDDAEPRSTICLSMIVKDESETIERCLASVKHLIDAWSICDTGSTDGTPELIEKALEGVPGTLHHTEWVDFGHNRTEALRLAKGTADFLLLIDADMTIDELGPLPELIHDRYALHHDESVGYWIERLVRGDLDFHYVGSTHEYLACDSEAGERRNLGAWAIHHHADGGTRHEKFERDRRLLEAELERDPGQDRATFYLAQTYRDMGETEKAIELYRERVDIGGWDEEVFYSALQVAELTAEDDPEASIPLYLAAFEMRPTRAEPLHKAAYACRRMGWHQSAYVFARRALEIPEPEDSLFVARDTYTWGSLFELSLAAHETGHRDEALDLITQLLDGREVPANIAGSARENRRRLVNIVGGTSKAGRTTASALSDLAPSTRTAEIRVQVEPAWPAFNPSIASDGDGFRMIVRTANYKVQQGLYSTIDGSDDIRTLNYLAHLDPDLTMTDIEPIHGDDGLERHPFAVKGWEDMRLVNAADRWYASATSRELNGEGVCQQVLLALDGSEITAARVMPGPDPHRHEKNWMPYGDGDELLFVYSVSPTIVTRVDPHGGDPEIAHRHDAPASAEEFRGGSQGIPVAGGTLFVIHEAFDFGGPRRYLHRFVRFDPHWRLDAVSPQFHFADHDVEICTGMARAGDNLVLSFGVGDFAAALAMCDEEEVLATLGPIG